MPRRTSAAPKHRADRPRLPRRLGIALAVTAAAVATTGAAATGVLPLAGEDRAGGTQAAELSAAVGAVPPASAAALRERGKAQVSRSDRRPAVDRRKAEPPRSTSRTGGQVSRTEGLGGGDPRAIARILLPRYGFGADQFPCLDALWTKESGWDVHADNPTSSAYGIPQSLPGEKMAAAGADWVDNPATQIRWGLGYIQAAYGTPCAAWAHSQSYNWY